MTAQHFYDFSAKLINGEEKSMADYRGKVVLVVNTASKCGLTPQYEGLQALYDQYHDRGLVILGFPCDQFAHQEPGTEEEIAQFCQMNYGVTFPMFAKINVNGKDTHPLYKFLKRKLTEPLGSAIKWNFAKFLISADGTPVKRFAPTVTPDQLVEDIAAELQHASI